VRSAQAASVPKAFPCAVSPAANWCASSQMRSRPMVHITTNEIQGRHAADPLAIGLTERAIERTPGLQVGAFILLNDTADHLAVTRLRKSAVVSQ